MNSSNARTVLITGITGQQGGAVARHLLERGFAVRGLTRDPNRPAARALTERGVDMIGGDFDDGPGLERALVGVDGAFSVQTFWDVGTEVEERHGIAFAEAAAAAGVRHLVYSSVGSAERATGIPHFESKWAIEEHIRRLGLPATILRPVAFMENWPAMVAEPIRAGRLPQPLSPDTRLQQVAVDDIGAFAALAFSAPAQWVGRTVELAGDAPSMLEMADAFSRALGHPVEYVRVPWGDFEAAAGAEATRMYRWFEEDGFRADIPALRETYPGLTGLDAFLRALEW